MRALVVWHHAGLGDHLICNGLVNYLADTHDRVFVPCRPDYLDAVRCLYSEQPKVEVVAVHDWRTDLERLAHDRGCEILRVGHEHTDRRRFDASFYRQLGIPFDVRYSRFALPRVIPHEQELYDRLAPAGEYCLVHREHSCGVFRLKVRTKLPIVFVERHRNPFGNLLAYRRLIANAAEIHCINSSVIHLVDGVATRAALFYHAVRPTDFTLRPCWTLVPYSTQTVPRLWRHTLARTRAIGRIAARSGPAASILTARSQ